MTLSTCRHLRAGGTAEEPWLASVTPEQAGWAYCGLRVLGLPPGGAHDLAWLVTRRCCCRWPAPAWSSATASGSPWRAGRASFTA